MALAFDSNDGHYNGGSVTSDSWSFTNTAGNILIVFTFTNSASGDVATGVTYNTVAMTKKSSVVVTGSQTIDSWVLMNPATGLNTLAITTSASTDIGSLAFTYSGAATSGQPDSGNTGTSGGTDLALSTTVVATGCWLVSASRGSSDGQLAAGTGTTLRHKAGIPMDGGDSNGTVGTGSQTMHWTASSAQPSAGPIVSIAPTASAATATVPASNLPVLSAG